MSTRGRNMKEEERMEKNSDYFLEKLRDDWRYMFSMSKKPSRFGDRALKRARSTPNMNIQLQVASQPTRQAPGLPKSRGMFGGYLRDTIDVETGASKFVVLCVEAIESTGEKLDTDALYRASGNQAKVQEVATTGENEMWEKLCKEENVNVLTGALKLYFRQLQRPIMEYRDFNRALMTNGPVEETRLLVGGLPAAERKTLAFLMRHLKKVLEHQEQNKMGIQSLGVIFGPTLMRLVPNSLDIGGDMKQQNRIIEFLLTECESIFPTQSDAVDGSHKTATLDIARRPSASSDSDSDSDAKRRGKPKPADVVKLRRQSDSSDSDQAKRRSADSSDSDGSATKRNLTTTIVRNRQSGGNPREGHETPNAALRSDSDSDTETGGEALYAKVIKRRPNNVTELVATAKPAGKAKSPSTDDSDSDDEAFDLPPPPPVPTNPPPVPTNPPRMVPRGPPSTARIHMAAQDVDQYKIEAISYRRKSDSDSSDSVDNVKYRKRVTAPVDGRAGMVEHLPKQQVETCNWSNTQSGVKDNSYSHNITTIDSQYKPSVSHAAAIAPPVDSNFTLDTYINRYKKPLSTRKVGDEANKRISAVFGKAPTNPAHDAEVLRVEGELGRRQMSTPVDSYRRRDGDTSSSSNSSSDSDSGDSQQRAARGQDNVFKPTAI